MHDIGYCVALHQGENFIVYSRNNSVVVGGLTSVQHSVIICQNFTGPQGSERMVNKTLQVEIELDEKEIK